MSVLPCVLKLAQISAVVSQIVTNKSCMVLMYYERKIRILEHPQTPVGLLPPRAKPRYLRILDFKTTWLEFQKASQTATERDKAKLPILNLKTT